MFTLFHHGSSVCAAKVRFAMAEKRLTWDGVYIDILKGEQFAPDYLKINPKAVVPTLVDGETVVYESTVICEYVEDKFQTVPIRPVASAERAEVMYWTKVVDEDLHLACGALSFMAMGCRRRFTSANRPPPTSERWRRTPGQRYSC